MLFSQAILFVMYSHTPTNYLIGQLHPSHTKMHTLAHTSIYTHTCTNSCTKVHIHARTQWMSHTDRCLFGVIFLFSSSFHLSNVLWIIDVHPTAGTMFGYIIVTIIWFIIKNKKIDDITYAHVQDFKIGSGCLFAISGLQVNICQPWWSIHYTMIIEIQSLFH